MYLSREDEAMLKGEMGLALQKAMEFLVKLGDAYEAKDMVRVSSCHTVSCVYNVVYEAGIEVAEKLLSMGARFQVPTTLCTASVPMKDAEVFGFPDDWIKAQQRLRELYKAMGAIDNWTCIPYWNINVPRFGEHVAWGESNCVSYANSVIGARTNRYSSYMEVCAAIAGRVPRIGLHLAENRKGHTLVKLRGLKHDKLTDMDYGLLGYAVGLAVKGQIPVVEGIPSSVSKRQLRYMGAAAASSGAVALYHVVGVTPEARSLEEAFQGDKHEDKVELGSREFNRAFEELSTASGGEVDLVFLGCPHYSIDEITHIANLLRGRRIHPGTELWVATDSVTARLAERMGYAEVLRRAGARLMVGSCAMNAPTYVRGFEVVATDSAKTAHYTPMQAKAEAYFASTEECVEIAVGGRID